MNSEEMLTAKVIGGIQQGIETFITAILEAVEPVIREDEQAKLKDTTVRVTGEIQERGRILGREQMLALVREQLVAAPLHYREVPAMTISELIMIMDRIEDGERG